MKAQALKIWQSRSPRDRKIMVIISTIVAILLYLTFVQSAQRARVSLRANVITLRSQAVTLDQQAMEYEHLRNAPAITRSPTNLYTILQSHINESGFSSSLLHMDAIDADQVTVAFGAVPFTDWLNWIITLKAQHIRIDTCRIEALSTPGLVSLTATLVRAKPSS